ncbi:MAG TPA: NTP transferase domain-containing protein, partial [Polyangiaceae bacterium]|nr:NTP transferase domain-containing protein [Polyangiaceae bacterium]
MKDVTAVVLAAGLGTRMKSQLPKVLHRIAGRPLIEFPVRAALELDDAAVVVVTSGHPEIEASLTKAFGSRVVTAVQDPPRGTGDAARVGLERVKTERTLILCGDTPLVTSAELERLLAESQGADLALLSAKPAEPVGYGRVLRGPDGHVLEIREQRDLKTDAERAVREVNAGMYTAKTSVLVEAVKHLRPMNAQG